MPRFDIDAALGEAGAKPKFDIDAALKGDAGESLWDKATGAIADAAKGGLSSVGRKISDATDFLHGTATKTAEDVGLVDGSVMDGFDPTTVPDKQNQPARAPNLAPLSQAGYEKLRDVAHVLPQAEIDKLQGNESLMARGMKAATLDEKKSANELGQDAIDSIDAERNAKAKADSKARKQFTKEHPYLAGAMSGTANMVAGTEDFVPLVADTVNQIINPWVRLAGGDGFGKAGRLPGAEYFEQVQNGYAPAITKKKLDDLKDGELPDWIAANAAVLAPQVTGSFGAALIPKIRTLYLGTMGAMSAGGQYNNDKQANIDGSRAIADSWTNGAIEILSEMLPLHVFDKVQDALRKIPFAQRAGVIGDIFKKTLAATGAFATQSGTEGIEEMAAQLGQNASQKYIAGDDKVNLSSGVKEAGVLGAMMGAPTGAIHAGTVAKGAIEDSHAGIGRALADDVAGTRYSPSGINAAAVAALDPNHSLAVDGRTVIPGQRTAAVPEPGQPAMDGDIPAAQLLGEAEPDIASGPAPDALTTGLWNQLATGDTQINGQPSPYLQAGNVLMRAGTITDINDFSGVVADIRKVESLGLPEDARQAALKGVVKKRLQEVKNGATGPGASEVAQGGGGGRDSLGAQGAPDVLVVPAGAGLGGASGGIAPGGAANLPAGDESGGAGAVAPAAPAKPLSIGRMPNSTEPITVQNGIIHIGKYPAQDFETGEDISVPANASNTQIRGALQKAGAISGGMKVFGAEPQAKPAKPAPSGSLLQRIKQLGGIDRAHRSDVLRDTVGGGSLYTKNGRGLDELATELAAEGFPINVNEVDGGVARLVELINTASEKQVYTFEEQERQLKIREQKEHRAELVEEAKRRGIKTVARKTEQILADLNALDAKEAAAEDRLTKEGEAEHDTIMAAIDTSDGVSSNGMTDAEVDALFGLEPQDDNQAGHAEAQISAGQEEAGQTAAGPAGGHQRTDLHQAQETGVDAGIGSARPSFGLSSQTEAGLAAQARARADEEAAAQAEADKAEKAAKQARVQKEIDARQAGSAENFQLGQSAEESLAGQGDIFSQPAADQSGAEVVKANPATFTKEADKASQNTIFTKDAADKARELLRKKLGQVGAGIDPEIMLAGMQLAGYYIEGGARSFKDYSAKMVGDLGDAIKPYLKSLYAATRNYPGFDAKGMQSDPEIVEAERTDEFLKSPERHNSKKLWDGSEPASAVTGEQPAYAGQPENPSGQTTPNAHGQSNANIAPEASQDESPIDAAAHEAATSPKNDLPEPSQAQKEVGNYKKAHVTIAGLDISIENPEGSIRSGTDANGKAWSNTLQHHYGYIKGTLGKDGDHVDVFVKPGTPANFSGPVFVIDQVKPGNGHFDEHKVMLGFSSVEEAKRAYNSNYEKGWTGGKRIAKASIEQFKAWLENGDTTKPFQKESALDAALRSVGLDPNAPINKAKLLRREADKLMRESNQMLEHIPGGQPVHSTADRNLRERARDKAHKANDLYKQAEELETAQQPAQEAKSEEAKPAQEETPVIRKGDQFKDGEGNTWEVWSARTSLIEAFPVIDGKMKVSRDDGVRFATDARARSANPEARTDFTMMPAKKKGATPQAMTESQFNSVIQIAADSIAKLRKSDVGRVLDETPAPFKTDMASRIKAARPDLADEVNELMADSEPAPAGKFTFAIKPEGNGFVLESDNGGGIVIEGKANHLSQGGNRAKLFESRQAAEDYAHKKGMEIAAQVKGSAESLTNEEGRVSDGEREFRTGSPVALTVFHGSDDGQVRRQPSGLVFFTDARAAASHYGKRVVSVEISLKNPLVIDYEGADDSDLIGFDIQDAQEAGHDGIIALNTDDGHQVLNQFVVFEYKETDSEGRADEFLKSPDGSIDSGEITDEQAKAMHRQAGQGKPDAEGVVLQADAIEPAIPGTTVEPVTPANAVQAKGQEARIGDFGRKVSVRKDEANPLGKRSKMPKAEDDRPAWARKYHAMQINEVGGWLNRPNVGKWQIMLETGKMKGAVNRASSQAFDTEQEALDAIPLVAVARKHRVYSYKQDGQTLFGIYRNITDRKRALVKGGFATSAEAMQYMAESPAEIIEHKFPFPERPWLDKIEREGASRREGDVTKEMFERTFAPGGVVYGNWLLNKDGTVNADGQALSNHAYDALIDLADTLGIPPKALFLNGEMVLGLGADGKGGIGSAAAHYSPSKVLINLTKIRGAGSAAHEWWHAVDHYFARNSGKADSDSVVAGGHSYNSTARPELMEAIKRVVDTIMYAEKSTTTDADVVRKNAQKRLDESVKSLDYHLSDLRNTLADGRYNKNKKVATKEQLAQWDALAAKLRNGEQGEMVYIENPSKMLGAMGYQIGTNIRDMNALYKSVAGHSFLRTDPASTGRRVHWYVEAIKDNKEKVNAKEDVTQTHKGRTEFYLEAKEIDSYHTGDYWSAPQELGARAFESYVFDKLTAGQNRSDYLVYAVENRYYAALGMKPYPEGSERVAINASFDNLFSAIQTKETDQGTALLSLSQRPEHGDFAPIDFSAAQAVVNRFIATAQKDWNLDITTAPTFDALPDKVKAAVQDAYGKDANPRGIVHDGVAYIVADEHASQTDVEETILHEIKGHVGVHRLYGRELVQKLNALYLAIGGRKGLSAIANKRGMAADLSAYARMLAGAEKLTDMQRVSVMMDEALAHIAQEPKFADRVKAIVGMIRAKLREYGFAKLAEYDETDLLYILSQSSKALKFGKDESGQTVLMVAWHGSPHDHDKFDMGKVGSGEGAQAYGHGLYFAGSKEVAEWYRNKLSGLAIYLDGERLGLAWGPISTAGAIAQSNARGRLLDALKYEQKQDIDAFIAKADSLAAKADKDARLYNDPAASKREAMIAEELRTLEMAAKDGRVEVRKGRLYQVELAPEPDEYLDWDKPLSEQSERVKKALEGIGFRLAKSDGSVTAYARSDFTGEDLYRHVVEDKGSDKAASEYLHSLGIRGIRYLDGSSRSAGEGNSNYVIFDDADVEITAKFSRAASTRTGLPISSIQSIIDAIAARFPRLEGVMHAVQSVSELPEGGLHSDIEGAYYGETGGIYLVADNLPTEARLRKVLAHESIGHLAMEDMLNAVDPKLWDSLVRQIALLEKGGNKLITGIARTVDERQPGLSQKNRAKEILALMAEEDVQNNPLFTGVARTTFQRFIDGIKAFMKLAFDIQMTDMEVLDIVKLAERHLGEKAGASSVVAGAKEALLSRSAMKSIETNIRRGREALAKAVTEKTSVHRAMFRNGLGWVDFVWGREGKIKLTGKAEGAMGFAHIIEARTRKDGMSDNDINRLLDDIVETIAKGEEVRRFEYRGSQNVTLDHKSIEAVLVKNPGSNAWVLNGWKVKPVAAGAGYVAPGTTHSVTTTPHDKVGAGFNQSLDDGGEKGKHRLYSRSSSTPLTDEIRQYKLRAAKKASMEDDTSIMDHVLGGKFLFKLTRADKLISHTYDAVLSKTGELIPEHVKAGLVSDYGLDERYLDRKADMKAAEAAQARKTAGLVEMLAGLTRAESRVAYQWMQARPDTAAEQRLMADLPEASRETLLQMKALVHDLSKEAVRLGQLSDEAFKRNEMAYLHRTYAKHVLNEEGAIAKMLRMRSMRIKGNQYKGRGIFEEVAMDRIMNTSPDFGRKLQVGKADKGMVGEKLIRFERRDVGAEVMDALDGFEQKAPGKLREVVYWPESQPVPAKYGAWANAGTWEARSTKGKSIVMWRDLTTEERTRLGELDEVRYAVAQTMQLMTHDIEIGRFFEWVSSSYAKPHPEGREVAAHENLGFAYGKDAWVQVPSTNIVGTQVKKYGSLAGMYVPGPIWSDMRQVAGYQQGAFQKLYGPVLRFWKKSKTAWSPGVHMNNIMANFVMADWHDIRAADLAEALKVWAENGRPGYKELFQRFEDSGALGGMFQSNELLRDEITKRLDEMKAELTGDAEAETGRMAKVLHLLALATVNPAKYAAKKAGDAYQAEDEFFRLAVFLKAIRYGKSDREAGKMARHAFLNYEINAPWVQAARHSVLPFISFFYRALPMALSTAKAKPWKIIKLMAFWSLVNALGAAMGGSDEEEKRRRKLLPEEKSGDVWGIVPKMIRMPWNSEDGAPIYLDIRRWIPVGDVADLEQGHGIPPSLVPGGPLVTAAEVVLFNKSLFTQKEIIDEENDTFREKALKKADYLFKAMMPNVPVPNPLGYALTDETGQMQTYAWAGIDKALTRKENTLGEVRSAPQAALNAIGVKVGSYPENNMRATIQYGLKDSLGKIDRNIKRYGRDFSRIENPDEGDRAAFDRKIRRQIEKKQERMEEARRRLD